MERLTRRQMVTAGFTAASWGRVRGANERIRVAVIGTGDRAVKVLMPAANAVPDVSLVAACDLYQAHLKEGLELCVAGSESYTDYRRVLDRKDIDACIIVTHNHWHAAIAVDALNAGKDIYIEKPMTHRLEEGPRIIRAAEENQRVVEVGTHRRSSPVHLKAREMVASGMLGKVTFARVFWSRNSKMAQWRRPIPKDASPHTIDWEMFLKPAPPRPFDAARFFQWFCYWDYCAGIAADLLVHSLDAAHMIAGVRAPERVVADGAILYWKDGREVPDTMSAIFHYPEDLEVNFSCTFANGQPGTREQFFGKEGTIDIAGESKLFFYREPTGPNKEPELSVTNSDLNPKNAPALHVQNFFECMRSRKTTNCPVETGEESAVCAHLATMSLRERRFVTWDPKQHRAT